jgi:hypothetical protein
MASQSFVVCEEVERYAGAAQNKGSGVAAGALSF